MARKSLKNVMRLINSAKETAPVEQSFLADLKRTIETVEKPNNNRLPSKTYKPSGMNCMRQSYFQLTGATPDDAETNYSLVGICNSGTDIHVRIQTYVSKMRDCGIDCEYIDVAQFVIDRGLSDIEVVSKSGMETKLYHKKFNMSFLCDGIVRYQNHYYILELKTESIYKWQNRAGVDESHYNQATAYSVALGLDEILFVYINRDVLDMKAFLFVPTSEMKQNLIGYIDTCDAYVAKNSVPPKPENVTKKTCTYCLYSELCRKAGG